MSSDIHAIVEVCTKGVWRLAEPARSEARQYFGVPDETDVELRIPGLELEQNYELFAILADVRNVRYPIEPIASPRGLPDDASEETRQLLQQNRDWMYCASWLLASELLGFDWNRTVQTPKGPRTYAGLATRTETPMAAPLFAQTFPKLRSLGPPDLVRVLFFFY